MKGLAIACALFSMLLVTVGCNRDTTQPAAQSPATDSSDRQEVMKPAIPADTTPEATTDEPSADDDSPTKETTSVDDDSPAKESEPAANDAPTGQEVESANP